MSPQILRLLRLELPLPKAISEQRANCFNAVELFWETDCEPTFTGPTEFVEYLESNFRQLSTDEKQNPLDVAVIWSRTSSALPIGSIRTDTLQRRDPGYPFGLVIEHAFVYLDCETVFQKRDPTELGAYEILQAREALDQYKRKFGFEVTYHRRKPRECTPDYQF